MKNVASISTRTRICAVIGNPVEHSLSQAIHNAAFAERDLDFVYVAFRVEDLAGALAGMRALENFRDLSVTRSQREEIVAFADAMAAAVAEMGEGNEFDDEDENGDDIRSTPTDETDTDERPE